MQSEGGDSEACTTHGVLECQKTMADPAPRGAVTAYVGESLVQVAVRSAEGDLLDGLVYKKVLGRVEEAGCVNHLCCLHTSHDLILNQMRTQLSWR